MNPEQEKLWSENLKIVDYALIRRLKVFPEMSYYDDLQQEGRIALMKAAETYKPELGAFSTLAVRYVFNHCYRALADEITLFKVPNSYLEAHNKWLHAKANGMTVEEFCKSDKCKWTSDYIHKVISVYSRTSLNDIVPKGNMNEDDTFEGVVADTIHSYAIVDAFDTFTNDDIDQIIHESLSAQSTDLRKNIWIDYIYAKLYSVDTGEDIPECHSKYYQDKYHASRATISASIMCGRRTIAKLLKNRGII